MMSDAITPLTPRPPEPRISASGLPAWVTVQLDAICAAGVISWVALDDLDTDQLVALAAAIVRAGVAAAPVDVRAEIAGLRGEQEEAVARAA